MHLIYVVPVAGFAYASGEESVIELNNIDEWEACGIRKWYLFSLVIFRYVCQFDLF